MTDKEPTFWGLLWQNKGWWLTPIVVVLLIIGGVVLLGGGEDNFIYTIF